MPIKSFRIKYHNLKTNTEEYLTLHSGLTDENELEQAAKSKIFAEKKIPKSQIKILSFKEN
ncbi:hypothetical protein ACE8FZ_24710 [Peribacillus frigoritolerans]|uniref:hypothetical protein n=1 Tax=Peribacillus frigoritolerans TaxID=450367 RepID=UPI0035D0E833